MDPLLDEDHAPPVDLAILCELTGFEGAMADEFLGDFQTLGAAAADELQRAAAQQALAALEAVAHRVKSSARYAGAERLGDLSETLELAANAGHRDEALAAVPPWMAEWARVAGFIARHLAGRAAP